MNENDMKNFGKIAVAQAKMNDLKRELMNLQNADREGRYHGVTIVMKGSFQVVSVNISQDVYETSSKENLEKIIAVCYQNLYNSISSELNDISSRMQSLVQEIQGEASFNGKN